MVAYILSRVMSKNHNVQKKGNKTTLSKKTTKISKQNSQKSDSHRGVRSLKGDNEVHFGPEWPGECLDLTVQLSVLAAVNVAKVKGPR